MKTTVNPTITRKPYRSKERTPRLLLAMAALLIICAQPCCAIKLNQSFFYRSQCISLSPRIKHSHSRKTKSTNYNHCKKGHDYRTRKDGCYTLKICKRCGKIAKKCLSKNIPTDWDSRINKALKTTQKRGNLPGYVYVTDPHWNKNARNSPAIVNYIVRQMGYSYAVCGGDIITGYHDNKPDAVAEIQDFFSQFSVPVLSILGNHDTNNNDNPYQSAHLDRSDINRLIRAHNPPGTRMSHNGDFSYIDDRFRQVRYIAFYYDETEAVAETVIDSIDHRVSELDDRWNVVLFSHAYWHYAKPGREPYPKADAKELAAKLLDIQKHSDATIVLWHVGHIHRDRHEVLTDGKGTQLLVVATNCDAYAKSTCWGGLEMTKGTATEQVIEIVQIDKSAGKIYMTRIGAGKNRSFSYK